MCREVEYRFTVLAYIKNIKYHDYGTVDPTEVLQVCVVVTSTPLAVALPRRQQARSASTPSARLSVFDKRRGLCSTVRVAPFTFIASIEVVR